MVYLDLEISHSDDVVIKSFKGSTETTCRFKFLFPSGAFTLMTVRSGVESVTSLNHYV